jgi:hypothetical protein
MEAPPEPPPPLISPNGADPPPSDNPPENLHETLPLDQPLSGASEQNLVNPSGSNTPEPTKDTSQHSLGEAVSEARASFRYNPIEPLIFDEAGFGNRVSADDFNRAVNVIISSIDKGFIPTAHALPLSPSEWARLSCKLLTAVGRGYRRTCDLAQESVIDQARAEAIDHTPMSKQYPTLFHRIAITAADIETHVSTDQEDYKSWYATLKENFNQKAARAAATEVEEKWRLRKAEEIEKRVVSQEAEISAAVRQQNARYLFTAAEELGLSFAPQNPATDLFSTPTAGKKRTVSGSAPTRGPDTPTAPIRISLPRAAKRTPSPSATGPSPMATPRGRPSRPLNPPATRIDPSPTPQPKRPRLNPQTALSVEPRTAERPMDPPPRLPPQGEDRTSLAMLQAILDRLEALERRETSVTRPPPRAPATNSGPTGPVAEASGSRQNTTAARIPEDNDFIPVTRNRRKRKGTGKTGPNPAAEERPAQINLTPASYAKVAARVTNAQQGPIPAKTTKPLPGITEITVLRTGGHTNTLTEQHIQSRAADAIVREVRLNIAKAVARPIPLRAGRWSISPHSKGNFVFSFDGCIPFDEIMPYEHILLGPFHGSGQLRPSLGWTRLLAHGVPFTDNEDNAFGKAALLTETRTLPGLKKAHFAMEPKWLRDIGSINSKYSTITFAISDPDGSTVSTLLRERTALFGKEVTLRKWIDKPALVQCSRCHALGHIKTSKVCPLGRDSIKCHICGGAHKSEEHDQKCPRKHAIAGTCDCKNYKCLNCQNQGHHCRDVKCPARERYRPRHIRKAGRGRDKGKGRAHIEELDLQPATTTGQSEDPNAYHPPTEEDFRNFMTEGFESNWRTGWDADDPLNNMAIDSGSTPPAAPNHTVSQRNEHSPSRPQSSAAEQSLP